MTTPYSNLPSGQYWRSGVADVHPTQLSGLYRKKFDIGFEDRIATAGSCFAQHVARHMKANGYDIVDAETLPSWLPADIAQKHGYGIYSARYGNIYTARQLLQLVRDCLSGEARPEDVWEKDGGFYDAIRPNVEPAGLGSVEEVQAHRRQHLASVRKMLGETDVLVFTLGLTETWRLRDTGTVYPSCPGVIAGRFDAGRHEFYNAGFFDIHADMVEAMALLRGIRPGMKFVLTLSPVPLTATASGDHVLVATTRSKAILRSVCATLADAFADVDYFPSYEIITSPSSRGLFYDNNLRTVTAFGVETVMRHFFAQHPPMPGIAVKAPDDASVPKGNGRRSGRGGDRHAAPSREDVVCEEALLEAFGQ